MAEETGAKGKKHLKATITIAMSNYLEAASIVAGAGGLSLWVEYLQLSDFEVGLLGAVSANGFGSAIGALLGGFLADRYGRKFVYKYDLVVYMCGVALISLAINFPMLLIGYVITGVAVGAAIPAAWTYIAEEAPPNERAARVGWGQFAWSVGPAISLLMSVALSPWGLLGSRIIFISLLVTAFITWILRQKIDESHVWTERQKKKRDATLLEARTQQPQRKTSLLRELITVKANRKAFLLLFGIYFFWCLVAGVMGYFMPYIYQIAGWRLTSTHANLLQASLWVFTILSTYFVFIRFGDKWNQRYLFSIGALMEIIGWIILVVGGMGWVELCLFVVIWGVAAGFGAQAFYSLWASELFKTEYRAAAQGTMFCLVRVGVGLISLVVPVMITRIGFSWLAVIMIALLFIHSLIGFLLAPETRGKTLDEIEKEWYGEEKTEATAEMANNTDV
ncbi:unnamed protein product [Didymodactylos carnosus]|uniref:Major facilitator superfamily (MFS) profile domain-containing protein n=1 Tax=Didymodactylos carnosus TaxID=1234261 RepID=A0A815G378_9BILA|nr:unnamed protein product [Didymodactylos carnosus]CAF1343868.1 unnamed protein product [Didymodactylos carnosus]CAF4154998.1 unnamed protein product [Didymodactylos carnosus]CAF4188858.1 unnamed protein product [Didymodactylos carnosus]